MSTEENRPGGQRIDSPKGRHRSPPVSEYERGRDWFARWMAEPQRRAAKEGWSHDDFDDCA